MAQNENASNHTVDNSDGVVESRLAVDDTRTDLPQRFIGASNSDVFDSAVTAVDESTLDGESESGHSFIDQTEHSAITERVAQRMTDTLTMDTARHNIPRDLVERVVWEVVRARRGLDRKRSPVISQTNPFVHNSWWTRE